MRHFAALLICVSVHDDDEVFIIVSCIQIVLQLAISFIIDTFGDHFLD